MSRPRTLSINAGSQTRQALRRDILLKPLRDQHGVGQYPRMLIQTMLPYQTPRYAQGQGQENSLLPMWTHTNGDITLRIESGYHPETNRLLGVPGGGTARLLMNHITTQVVVRRSRHIYLGETITALLGRLGFHRAGDRYREVRDQLFRLAFARISYIDKRRNPGQHSQFVIRQSLVTDTVHFWEAKRVQSSVGPSEYGGTLHLTTAFFEELLRGCVPVDPRVLVYFRKSPLTMDLYAWLTYKCTYMERSGRTELRVSWQQLHEQFPANYQCTKQFARRVRKALLEIKGLWPTLRYETPRGRLILKKTRSHVSRT